MITLESFFNLLDKNAKVKLFNAQTKTACYNGTAGCIPIEYSGFEVQSFYTEGDATMFFLKPEYPKPKGNGWIEGCVKPGRDIIHFWVKQYAKPSSYGINGGRISKLMLRCKGEIVCNYDRGWVTKPTTEDAEVALEILLYEYGEKKEE